VRIIWPRARQRGKRDLAQGSSTWGEAMHRLTLEPCGSHRELDEKE
jgi:hypothetical protein